LGWGDLKSQDCTIPALEIRDSKVLNLKFGDSEQLTKLLWQGGAAGEVGGSMDVPPQINKLNDAGFAIDYWSCTKECTFGSVVYPSTRVLLRIVHLNHSLVTIDVPQGDFMGVALKAGFFIAVALALAILA